MSDPTEFTPEMTGYTEAPDMTWQIQTQITRCLLALSEWDPSIFEAAVRGLLKILPIEVHDAVYSREKEFNSKYEKWQYMKNCGVNMGTPKNPLKHPQTGEILSPILITVEETEYEELFRVIISELQESNMIYKSKGVSKLYKPKNAIEIHKKRKIPTLEGKTVLLTTENGKTETEVLDEDSEEEIEVVDEFDEELDIDGFDGDAEDAE